MSWWDRPAAALDPRAARAASERQAGLTKPPGSLGRLEEVAVSLASMAGEPCPSVDPARVLVFCGDHGIAGAGVSAYPQRVTAQMVANMARGGAAISVLAETLGTSLELVVLGTVGTLPPGLRPPKARLVQIGRATADLSRAAAMSSGQLADSLAAGREAVERARADGCRLLIGGEMGIGNSTAAAALGCALLDQPGPALAGPGTGLDRTGIEHKATLIDRALRLHRHAIGDPLEALRCLGGFEIAALTGTYLRAAQLGIPVLIDGFIATSAALAAVCIEARARDWMLFGHRSREPGQGLLLERLRAEPLLDLGLGLGEGSGAAAALPLLRIACRLHRDMASFAEAGVDGRMP